MSDRYVKDTYDVIPLGDLARFLSNHIGESFVIDCIEHRDVGKDFDMITVKQNQSTFTSVFKIEPKKGNKLSLNKKEPMPVKNDHSAVWDLVIGDMEQRDKIGAIRYGTRLQPFNGRDVLTDAYQEALDLVVYLRQAIYERDNK